MNENVKVNTNNRYKQDIDMNMNMFATISGIKGNQFGHDIYSTELKFKDLEQFLGVFKNVQRDISKSRVRSIKEYILSGLEDNQMRFFSAITATLKGNKLYDETSHRLGIDTNSKMSINDGQHRFEAIKEAIAEIARDVEKNSRDVYKKDFYEKKLEKLKNMTIPIIIFDGLTEDEEKQLFHDLNSLSRRPSGSANIRFSQNDLYARLARELSAENRYLKHYGVELDKKSIHMKNENTFLLTTIYGSFQTLLMKRYQHEKNSTPTLKKENFAEKKEYVNSVLDNLFYVLPSDINVKNKYVLQKNYGLRGVMKFINYLTSTLGVDEKIAFETIAKTDLSNNVNSWKDYNGTAGRKGDNVTFNATSTGIMAVYRKLLDNVEESVIIEAKAKAKTEDEVPKNQMSFDETTDK